MELYNKSLNVLLSKGLFVRPPYISPAETVDFVKKQNFLTGWLGERRPLTAIEISHIQFNLRKSIMCKTLVLGFSQVAKSKQVREHMSRIADVKSNHIEIFRSILLEDELPSPPSWDSDVTNSTVAPFSDKLMMFHAGQLISFAIAYYGTALSASMRRDLGTKYTQVIAKDLTVAEDGANIMIENGWVEQPPQAEDRKALAGI
jgi:hypothetical protein